MTISEEAAEFIKKNKKQVIEKFCNIKDFPSSSKPFTMFMAGSPGAGKTEFSKSIIPELQLKDTKSKIVRIDADDVREIVPQYTGHNSNDIQKAAVKGVEVIFDYVNSHNQNCILDGTFQNFEVSRRNLERAIARKRDVGIFYIYQNPVTAWSFTKKREKLDGRYVPKDVFIKAFFDSKENVLKIKSIYKDKVELNVIIQDEENHVKKIYFNTPTIEKSLHSVYTIGQLDQLLDEAI